MNNKVKRSLNSPSLTISRSIRGLILFVLPILTIFLSDGSVLAGNSKESLSVENFEDDRVPTGWTVGGNDELIVTSERFKSGGRSLRWSWRNSGARLTCDWPAGFAKAQTQAKQSLAIWMYNERPTDKIVRMELLNKDAVVGVCWYVLNFKGWRPLAAPYPQALAKKTTRVTGFRLHAPVDVERGSVYIDYVNTACAGRVFSDDRQPWINHPEILSSPTPEKFIYSSQDIAINRPWMPTRVPADQITSGDREDLAKLLQRFPVAQLSPKADPGILKDCQDALRISRKGEFLTGRPIVAEGEFNPPSDGLLITSTNKDKNSVVDLHVRLAQAYLAAKAGKRSGEAEELLRAFFDFCDHLDDQGGLAIDTPYFASMRGELESSGRLRTMVVNSLSAGNGFKLRALVAKDHFDTSETIFGNADMIWGPYYQMPKLLMLLPDPSEKIQFLRAYKRLLDDICSSQSPEPFQVDGTAHHHNMFHINYCSSSIWRLIENAYHLRDTSFRLAPSTMAVLKKNILVMAFASNRVVMAPSIPGYTGAPFLYDAAPWAEKLAYCGTPEGGQPIDPEMAALFMALTKEPDGASAREFKALGIKPFDFDGHLTLNSAAISLHRRDGWLVTIAGMNSHYRGLEQNAAYPVATYCRYARNGSVFVTSAGDPPSPFASGYRFNGWDHRFWPGATSLLVPPQDLLRCGPFYVLDSLSNFAGGTSLDLDGVWGEDFISNDSDGLKEMRFRKSAFCFGGRVTVITTDIAHMDNKTERFVTALFQCAFGIGNSLKMGGPEKPIDAPPAEEPSWVDGKEVREFPWNATLDGDKPHWLMDNKGNGYFIPSGNPRVQVARRPQSWTCFGDPFLKDPSHPLKPVHAPMSQFPEKPLSANEKYYNPTTGDFAIAWFEHGPGPDVSECVYTVMPKATPDKIARFAEEMANETGNSKLETRKEKGKDVVSNEKVSSLKFQASSLPPYRILQKDAQAHILWDRDSNTTAYVIFDPNWKLESGNPILDTGNEGRISRISNQVSSFKLQAALLSANRPCWLMVRGDDKRLRLSVATTANLKRNGSQFTTDGEIVLTLAKKWKIKGESGGNSPIRIHPSAANSTMLSVANKDFMPIQFDLEPLEPQ